MAEVDGINNMKKLFVNCFCNLRPSHHSGSPFEQPGQNGKLAKSIFPIYKTYSAFRTAPKKNDTTPLKYCANCRSQNVRGVFPKKLLRIKPGGWHEHSRDTRNKWLACYLGGTCTADTSQCNFRVVFCGARASFSWPFPKKTVRPG